MISWSEFSHIYSEQQKCQQQNMTQYKNKAMENTKSAETFKWDF